MIDIHSHILIDVDDGPGSIDEALKLLNQAKSEGITDIIVTPHHLHPNWSLVYPELILKLNELKSHPEVEEIGINLYPGQEIRIKDQLFLDLENINAIGLNNTKYILIELPSSHIPIATKNIIFELQQKGYIPIIAHPERNKEIVNDLSLLYELIKNGALAQLTSSSLNGDLGKKVQKNSIRMIEHNLVHFIASDAHNETTRPFILNSLFKNKKLTNYQNDLYQMLDNAKKLLHNENILIEKPEEPKRKSRFFGLV